MRLHCIEKNSNVHAKVEAIDDQEEYELSRQAFVEFHRHSAKKYARPFDRLITEEDIRVFF